MKLAVPFGLLSIVGSMLQSGLVSGVHFAGSTPVMRREHLVHKGSNTQSGQLEYRDAENTEHVLDSNVMVPDGTDTEAVVQATGATGFALTSKATNYHISDDNLDEFDDNSKKFDDMVDDGLGTEADCWRVALKGSQSEGSRQDSGREARNPRDKANVRCCRGTAIDASATVPMQSYSNTDSQNCNKDKTFEEADAICKSYGLNLCSEAQIIADVTKYTGCGYDNTVVWTSTCVEALLGYGLASSQLCPHGYVGIAHAADCSALSAAYGLEYQFDGSWSSSPVGCIKDKDRAVTWFNMHPAGARSQEVLYEMVVCKKSLQATRATCDTFSCDRATINKGRSVKCWGAAATCNANTCCEAVSDVAAFCSGNKFGPFPGGYERWDRLYLAEESTMHACQTQNVDLIVAAHCLTEITDCEFEAGCYGLRLANSYNAAGYLDDSVPNTCLNHLTGTTDFYQRTANNYVHMFVSKPAAFASLNNAMASIDIIHNGGFEDGLTGWQRAGAVFGYNAATAPDRVRADSGKSVAEAWGNPQAKEGNSFMVLHGHESASIMVTVFLMPGTHYNITWYESKRAQGYSDKNLSVTANGETIAAQHLVSNVNPDWLRRSASFVAKGEHETRVQFLANSSGGHPGSLFLDQITLTQAHCQLGDYWCPLLGEAGIPLFQQSLITWSLQDARWYYNSSDTKVGYGETADDCDSFMVFCAGGGTFGSATQQAAAVRAAIDNDGVHPKASMIDNGGFEDGLAGWQRTGSVFIYNAETAPNEPQPGDSGKSIAEAWANPQAKAGDSFVVLHSNQPASITATVYLKPGTNYSITWYESKRAQGYSNKNLTVKANGEIISAQHVVSNVNPDWVHGSASFVTKDEHETHVEFFSTSSGAKPGALFLDQITLTQARSSSSSVSWNINTELAGSCDAVCAQLGSTCSQEALDNLELTSSNQKPDALKDAFERATGGTVTCNQWNTDCVSGNAALRTDCESWGLPFVHTSHFSDNRCWGGDKAAPCGKVPYKDHRRLCPCHKTEDTINAMTKYCMHKLYCFSLMEDLPWDVKCKCMIGVGTDDADADQCTEWQDCLQDETRLDVFMSQTLDVLYRLKFPYRMGHSSTSSLQQAGGRQDNVAKDVPGCIHPDSSSQEELACDCWDGMRAECNHLSGNKHFECIRKLLCASPNICHSWKQPDDPAIAGQCTASEISGSPAASLAVESIRKAERALLADIFQGRRQPPRNISSMDPSELVLEQSLSGKSCTKNAR